MLYCGHTNTNQRLLFTDLWCIIMPSSHQHGQDKTVLSVRVGSVNRIGDKSRLSASENFETVLYSVEMRCEQSFVLSWPSFQFATRTCSQTHSHRRQDWTKLSSLQYIEDYWKQCWLVADCVLTADKTRQCRYSKFFCSPSWHGQGKTVLSCPCQSCELGITMLEDLSFQKGLWLIFRLLLLQLFCQRFYCHYHHHYPWCYVPSVFTCIVGGAIQLKLQTRHYIECK